MKRKFHLLIQYFGEEYIKPEELFGIFSTLLRQLEVNKKRSAWYLGVLSCLVRAKPGAGLGECLSVTSLRECRIQSKRKGVSNA